MSWEIQVLEGNREERNSSSLSLSRRLHLRHMPQVTLV